MGNSTELSIKPQLFFCLLRYEKEEQKQKAREDWIRVYKQLGSVSKAALRYGIARSTLHRWIKRLPDEGLAGRSRRPYRLGRQKFDDDIICNNQPNSVHQGTCRYGKIRISSYLLQLPDFGD